MAIASERAGGFALKAVAPAEGASGAFGAALEPVTVRVQALADGTTEGSGSYTTRSTATGLGLSIRGRRSPSA